PAIGRARCSAGWPRSRRSRPWWSMFARPRPPRPMARRFASMAAWSVRSSETRRLAACRRRWHGRGQGRAAKGRPFVTGGGGLGRLTACAALDLLQRGEVSPLELIDAALARIAAVDPQINAMVTLCPDRAREQARRLMAGPRRPPGTKGWLAGLPLAV